MKLYTCYICGKNYKDYGYNDCHLFRHNCFTGKEFLIECGKLVINNKNRRKLKKKIAINY
jgi:hypothetical protein